MFTNACIKVFHTSVQPLTSGNRTIKSSDGLVDIDDLRKALRNKNNIVIVKNDVSKWGDATKEQTFINTDVLASEEGYEETYTFTHWGRSLSGATNRKIVMSFKGKGKTAELKATYFGS